MKIYFDTEFTGLHQRATLVSIGLITEDEQEFYAELIDYDQSQVDNWLQENIINRLYLHKENEGYPIPSNGLICQGGFLGDSNYIKGCLTKFLSQFDEVQMISDCLSYDWVLFCQLWGHAFNIPSNVSPAPRDINQDIADYWNISEKAAFDADREIFAGLENSPKKQKHNSLWDAIVIKACDEKISVRVK